MLIDFENTGYIKVCSSPDIIPIEEKNTYIPTSTWGYIRGDIAEQSDLMDLLANIESGLTAEQISLLVNADDRLDSVERDIAALETSHEVDITHINTEISKKANIVDVYTKSEIDSKNYLTEHQSLTGYATESWVYSKGYLSDETDPIWSAEKHKYALKAELPSMVGYAKENWVSEQLTAKANATDVYSKTEIDGKNFITAPYLNEQLLAKANTTDVYTKVEIDSKEYISEEQLDERLLGKADVKDVYTKAEIDGKEYITSTKLDEYLLAKANTTDVYTKTEVLSVLEGYLTPADLIGYATESWVSQQGYLTEHQSLANYYTKSEVDTAIENVDVDLTGYATEDWVEKQNYLTEQSLDNYYTKEEVDTAIENVEVDLSEYYTKEEVDTAIENVEVDLTGYATEVYVDTGLEKKVDYSKIWTGTQDEWDALPVEEQNSYIIAMIEL
jgi:hypothetical protein